MEKNHSDWSKDEQGSKGMFIMMFFGIGMGVGVIITGFIIQKVSVKAAIYS